ncbi:hypothetical protein FD754_023402 [Muntiacus muntjak]|uniref:ABC transmembrane type-1 domain-containing protein n=1 Tax=Muntiacus muntjak TaxID=9888 RepID=A0A5N3UTP9_MUNMU|nr:hypothetical protein FD754_023403 [Muntiacus muntjak]KAB0340103.1 hypothetical protein FD754_023402 [Muntiacus muntjak]
MVAAIPWIAIPVIPLGILFFVLQWYFFRTSRDVKRLECTTRSPVFSHLASSLRGLWTIRAYKAEHKFQELFDACQDLHSEAWFLLLTTSRWLAVYLDVICAIFVTVVAFGALILVETLDLGQVGVVLSLTVTLTGMFQWCVRQSAEVENMMISVERVIEYTDLEKEVTLEYMYVPPSWPHKGTIFFDNVNFRYESYVPLILKDLRTYIGSGAKYWSFSFNISPSNEHPGLISLRWTALTRWTFVEKVMSLLFNMLSRLVITFFPRSKCLLISRLQSPSAVILEPQKNNFVVHVLLKPVLENFEPYFTSVTLSAFALFHSVLQGQICLLLQVFLDFLLLPSSPL